MEKSNASGTSEKKKKSRKQRRNTRDLQSKYAQRQRENKWLETHLWHAKRMKMCKKYGYCLSEHCSDKGVRAAYMSLTHGCLISVRCLFADATHLIAKCPHLQFYYCPFSMQLNNTEMFVYA